MIEAHELKERSVFASRVLTSRVWVVIAICGLVGCPNSKFGGPVCGVSVVEKGRSFTKLTVGWMNGPLTTSLARELEDTLPIRTDLYDVDEARAPNSFVIRYMPQPFSTSSATIRDAEMQGPSGSWTRTISPFVSGSGAERVSATSLAGTARVCYVQHNGSPELAFPSTSGARAWDVGDIEFWGTAPQPSSLQPSGPPIPGAGNVGKFIDIACAGAETPVPGQAAPSELHVCAVTDDGRLWHTIFDDSSKTWLPFGEVAQPISPNGKVLAVDCVTDGRQLDLVAVAKSPNAYFVMHTARSANGQWRPWEDVAVGPTGVPQASGTPINDVAVDFCDTNGPRPLNGAPEPRRLTIAWVTDDNLTMVQRSRYLVQWQLGLTPSQVSPPLNAARWDLGISPGQLFRVGVLQRPIQPEP